MRLSAYNSTATTTYTLTETPIGGPYLHVNDNYYLPLTTDTSQGLRLTLQSGTDTYRPMVYTSASGSTYDSYYTSSIDPGNMSSTTALTRSSTSGITVTTEAATTGITAYTAAATTGVTATTEAATTGITATTAAATTGATAYTAASESTWQTTTPYNTTTEIDYNTYTNTTTVTVYDTITETTALTNTVETLVTKQVPVTSYTNTRYSFSEIQEFIWFQSAVYDMPPVSMVHEGGYRLMSSDLPNMTVDWNDAKYNDGTFSVPIQFTVTDPRYVSTESHYTWNNAASTSSYYEQSSEWFSTRPEATTPQTWMLSRATAYHTFQTDGEIAGELTFESANYTSYSQSSQAGDPFASYTRVSMGSYTRLQLIERMYSNQVVYSTLDFTGTHATVTPYDTVTGTTATSARDTIIETTASSAENTTIQTTTVSQSTYAYTSRTEPLTCVSTISTEPLTCASTISTAPLTCSSTTRTEPLTCSSTVSTDYLTRSSTSGYTGVSTSTSSSSMTTWQ